MMPRIAAAGNVVVPAYLTLKQRGYSVRCEPRGHGQETWYACKGEFELIADDVVSLLSLAAIAETRGDKWQASDDEIERFFEEFPIGE